MSPDRDKCPNGKVPFLLSSLVPCSDLPVAGPLARALAGPGARCSPESI